MGPRFLIPAAVFFNVNACGQDLRVTSPVGRTCGSHRLWQQDLRVTSPVGRTCGSHRLQAGPAGRIACGRDLRVDL